MSFSLMLGLSENTKGYGCQTAFLEGCKQVMFSGFPCTAQETRDSMKWEMTKVIKRIPCGNLRGDATLPSTQEAKLLGNLRHPFIVQFFASFLEKKRFLHCYRILRGWRSSLLHPATERRRREPHRRTRHGMVHPATSSWSKLSSRQASDAQRSEDEKHFLEGRNT
ncbi:unnamed protein product, partial [Ranitomeya imitator]